VSPASSQKVAIVCVIGAVACAILAAQLAQRARAEEASLILRRHQQDLLNGTIAAAAKDLVESQAAVAAASAWRNGQAESEPSLPTTATSRFKRMKDDALLRFGPWFHRTGASPELIERLTQRDAEYNLTKAKLDQRIAAAGSPVPEALAQEQSHETAEYQSDLKSMLGEADFASLTRYNQTYPLRNVSDQLAEDFYQTATPLTGAQADQLTEIFASHAKQAGDSLQLAPGDWDASLEEAKSALLPAQWGALQIMAENEQMYQKRRQIPKPTEVP